MRHFVAVRKRFLRSRNRPDGSIVLQPNQKPAQGVALQQDARMETTMKLNHVNLPVADVPATRDFFEKHFGFHCIAEPTDANVVLTDNAGLVLTISNFDHADQVTYPKWFHVGFMQDSDEKVDNIYERLKKAGMQPGKPENMHGARTFYFTAPGGFTVEVFH